MTLPVNILSCLQRNHDGASKLIAIWNTIHISVNIWQLRPFFLFQFDKTLISRQSVKISSIFPTNEQPRIQFIRGKGLQLVQTSIFLKDLSIQFQAEEFGETPGTALLTLLVFLGMRSRICSQEQSLAARLHSLHQSLSGDLQTVYLLFGALLS